MDKYTNCKLSRKHNQNARWYIPANNNDRIASDKKWNHASIIPLGLYTNKAWFPAICSGRLPGLVLVYKCPSYTRACMYVAGTARTIIILLQWFHKTSTGSSILLLNIWHKTNIYAQRFTPFLKRYICKHFNNPSGDDLCQNFELFFQNSVKDVE